MKVKTVIIVNDFNYIQGGASKVAIDTARILKDNNIRVIFFSAVNKEKEKIEGKGGKNNGDLECMWHTDKRKHDSSLL